MDPVIWAALLLALGLATGIMELFVPSGGILGLLSLGSLLGSIGLAFVHGPLVGLMFLAMVVLGAPVVLSFSLRWWPHTPVGRRLLLKPPHSADVLPDSELRRRLKGMVGKFGEAQTLMTPSGAVLIEGRVVDAVSDGTVIEPGQRVRVLEVRGNRVVVHASDEPAAPADALDPLSQPIDSLGLDPFEDPLA